MHCQTIMLCLAAFISLSTCNRVYVHPFNLLTYTKSECEKVQSQDHSTEKMFFPTAIESINNAEETDFKLQTNQEASDLGTPETYLISLISDFGFRAVAQWWKLHKMDNILIPYTDLFRTMVSFYHGASGNTSNSLQAFLGFQDPSLIPNCTSKVNGLKVISKLKKIDNFLFSRESNINTLRTVCMFVSNAPLSEKFVQGLIPTAENFYVKAVDFKDSPKAIKLINEFLDAKLPKNTKSGLTSIDGTTNFMYFSHVQFKGKVAKSFLIPNHQPFWTELNKKIMVPMISVSGIFQFTEDNTANQLIIKISLTDNDFLLLVQPINGNTLENIESSMERDTYIKWVNSLPKKYTYINLSLPKLKIQHSYNIQDLLESLNVSYLLGKNADFSRMSNTDIKVGKVINMVDFELEETGVEPNGDGDVPQTKEEPVEFKLNTPFLFAICEGTTKSLLLLGRVAYPTNII